MNIKVVEISSEHLAEVSLISGNRKNSTISTSLLAIKKEYLQIKSERFDNNKTLMIFVALNSDNQVCGYARIKKHSKEDTEPSGWYQMGIVVKDKYRRFGIATKLCLARDAWPKNCDRIYCFINSSNLASIDLHLKLGFVLINNNFKFPNVEFNQGVGYLYCKTMSGLSMKH